MNFPRRRHSSRGWDKDTLNEVANAAAGVAATDVGVGDYDGVKDEQVDDGYAYIYSPLYLQSYPERSSFVSIRGVQGHRHSGLSLEHQEILTELPIGS